jgi:hypothetical protein
MLPGNNDKMAEERLLPGLKNRILQLLARIAPGATTLRVRLNRWRGVNIGKDVWIGYDVIIETSCPHFVTIRDGAAIGMRGTLIAHNREQQNVDRGRCHSARGDHAGCGDGRLGTIVTAGSVTRCVPPKPWCKESGPTHRHSGTRMGSAFR